MTGIHSICINNYPNSWQEKKNQQCRQNGILVYSSVLESIIKLEYMAGFLTYSVIERLPIGRLNQQWLKICSKHS